MVLPRISTNVSVIDLEPEADPLPLYLALDRPHAGAARRHAGAAFARQALPRPAHAHRAAARRTTTSASPTCWPPAPSAPQSAADLLPVLFKRPLDLHQTTFAMGESIAHLHALWLRGELRRELGERRRAALLAGLTA